MLQRSVVHVDLYGVDFIPGEPEPFEFTLESGLVIGLIDGHDEATEHVHPHLLKSGVHAFEDRSSVALEFVAREAGCAVNGHELGHAGSDSSPVAMSSVSRLRRARCRNAMKTARSPDEKSRKNSELRFSASGVSRGRKSRPFGVNKTRKIRPSVGSRWRRTRPCRVIRWRSPVSVEASTPTCS